MNPSPGEDDPRRARDYADLPRVDVTIPDDARELDREAEQLRRERRRAARREHLTGRLPARLLLGRRWRRYGLSAPLVVAVLIFVGAFGGLLVLLGPSRAPRLRPQPLATGLSAPDGQVGGLVVADRVIVDGRSVDVRALRPAVLLLLPTPCRCDEQVRTVVREATSYDVSTYLVPTGAAPSMEIDRLATESANGLDSVVLDPGGLLLATYQPHGVTVVVMRPDGVVAQVVRDLTPSQQLTKVLDRLLLSSHRPS